MTLVGPHVGFDRALTDNDEQSLRGFAKLCERTGVTTITDLAVRLQPDTVDAMLRITAEGRFTVRIVPLGNLIRASQQKTWHRVFGVPTRHVESGPVQA